MEGYKVVIDANLWISFLIKKHDTRLVFILTNPSLEIIYSPKLLEEIRNTASNSHLSKKIDFVQVIELISYFPDYFTEVVDYSQVDICRDPKDNYLLALAKDAQAHFLLTNDKDLLVLNPFENTHIVKLHDFLTILQTLP